MQQLFASILDSLQNFVAKETGSFCPRADFCTAKDAPLSCRHFVRGAAKEAAQKLQAKKEDCLWNGIPLLQNIYEKNGWLLFDFTDRFFVVLCDCIRSNAPAPIGQAAGEYAFLANRLGMWVRQNKLPCPHDAKVQRALWLLFYDVQINKLHRETQQAILCMTQHLDGTARVELEHALGAVAQAMLCLLTVLSEKGI